jgi:hypothetical protein
MIPFLLGFCAGSVAAVMSPKVFRFVADKVAEAKAKIGK